MDRSTHRSSAKEILAMPSPWRNPRVRIVLVVETTLIAFLSYWILEEYLNNAYLQSYLSRFVELNRFAFTMGLTATILASIVWVVRLQKNQKKPHDVTTSVQ